MATVVQFRQQVRRQSDERSGPPSHLRDYLSALAEKLHAIESHTSTVEKDLQVVQSIMRSTENPELRERLLDQMKYMHDQLLLVSLSLLSAKQSIEKA
jgi:hypothetical protein